MAVQDKFIDALVAAGKKGNPGKVSGGKICTVVFTFEQAAADNDTSVYRLARLPANAIPVKCEIYADGAIDGSDYDLGLYDPGVGGAVVDANCFADAIDLSSGVAVTAGANNGLKSLAIEDVGSKIWEILDLSAPGRQDYDLCLTANTAGGAAGTISGFFQYILG